jgi:cytidyltransferase-like protein
MSKIVCISGYFDPIHVGHLEYIKRSKELGDYLIVIVNNDHQASLKKGKSFMPDKERVEIVKAIRHVDQVVLSIDQDRTVRETLKIIEPRPHIFANGGDQNNLSIPEAPICEELGIDLVDGLGDKIQSSSWLIKGTK